MIDIINNIWCPQRDLNPRRAVKRPAISKGFRRTQERCEVLGKYAGLALLAVILMLALTALPAGAADRVDKEAGRRGDAAQKIALLTVFAAIDYGQSVKGFYQDGHFLNSYELNPVLGKYPTRRDMLAFGVVGIGLTWLLSEILPEPWGDVLLDSVLASEQFNVEENARVVNGQRRRINAIPIIVAVRF